MKLKDLEALLLDWQADREKAMRMRERIQILEDLKAKENLPENELSIGSPDFCPFFLVFAFKKQKTTRLPVLSHRNNGALNKARAYFWIG
jgi:hypothetical protein